MTSAATSARTTTVKNVTFHGELLQIFFKINYIFSGLTKNKEDGSFQQHSGHLSTKE
jgi:hypothetical protein